MLKRGLEPFDNTPGCTELVYGTSIAGKGAARAAIRNAVKFSTNAQTCEKREQIADAFYWWRKMFDWHFTQY